MRQRIPLGLRQRILGVVPAGTWLRVRTVLDGESAAQEAVRAARLGRHQQRHAQGVGTVSVAHEGRFLVAEEVDSFSSEATRRDHITVTAEILDRAGIDWVLLDEGPARRSVVIVSDRARDRVLQAVRRAGTDATLHVAGRRGAALPAARVNPRTCSGHHLLVFRLKAHGTRVLEAGDLGCEVQFWSESVEGQVDSGGDLLPPGTLTAPVKNRWVDHIEPDEWASARRGPDGCPRLTRTRGAHVDDIDFPIDVVYTWVDGEDPAWLRRKAEATGPTSKAPRHATAANESRYQDHDELRYSLRSLEMYASWIRHIYLVTDDQVPPWLDTTHPKITLVDHRDIFEDAANLPTFNSHAIEAQLQNIDGLSEHFLYLNDDVFLGRPVAPGLFFTPAGSTRFFPSTAKLGLSAASQDEAPVMTAAKNNRDLLRARFGRTFTAKMKHVPHALRRSVLVEMEETFPQAYAQTTARRFRSPEDHAMVSSLHHWYAYLTNRAQPGSIRYFYTDINHEAAPRRLHALAKGRDVDALCLNDHAPNGSASTMGRRALGAFLEETYPMPSSFER